MFLSVDTRQIDRKRRNEKTNRKIEFEKTSAVVNCPPEASTAFLMLMIPFAVMNPAANYHRNPSIREFTTEKEGRTSM